MRRDSADWSEQASRKLPGMSALPRSIALHPAAAGPVAPPAGGSVARAVRPAGWLGGGWWSVGGGGDGPSPGLSR